jgi:NADH-ubiquinone oxidoreductase chain 6
LFNNNENIYMVISNSWDKSLIDNVDINSIGNIMYTSFSIWLILISLILLLSMIGSIIITIKQ